MSSATTTDTSPTPVAGQELSEEERLFPNSKYLKERWNWDRPIQPSSNDATSSPIRYYDDLVKSALELLDGNGKGDDRVNIEGHRYVGVTDILELNVTRTTTAEATASSTTSNSNNNSRTIYVGNVLAFLWQSYGGQWVDIHEAVAAYWAIHDFNHRISRFPDPNVDHEYYSQYFDFDDNPDEDVPDLFYDDGPLSVKRLTKNCDLYLTLTVRDNTDSNFVIGHTWQETFFDLDYPTKSKMLRPISTFGNYASRQAAIVSSIGAVTTTGYHRHGQEQQKKEDNPSAGQGEGNIDGSGTSGSGSRNVGIVTGENDLNVGMMTLSNSAGAEYLDDVDKYPLFGRLQTGRTPVGNGLMMYYDSIGCTRLAVLSHIDTSPEFLDDLIKAQSNNYPHIHIDIVRYTDDPDTDDSISRLIDLDMRYHLAHSITPEMLLRLIDSGLLGTTNSERGKHDDYDDTNVWLFFGGSLIDYRTDPVIEYGLPQATASVGDADTSVPDNVTAIGNATDGEIVIEEEEEEELDEVALRLHEIYLAIHNQGFVWFSNRLGDTEVVEDRKMMMQEMMFTFRKDEDAMNHLSQLHLGGQYDIFGRDKEEVLNITNPFFETFTDPSFEKPIHDWMLASYDMVMSMGIAACQEMSRLKARDGDFEGFGTKSYFERWKNVEFVGATGNVAFDTITGSKRRARDFAITIYHLQTIPNKTAGTLTLEEHTSIHIGYNYVKGLRGDNMTIFPVDDYPFRYPLHNGSSTTIAPSPLPRPPVENRHLVPMGVQVACWVLSSIMLLSCLYCLVWTYLNKHRSRLQASQPTFLGMLCVGSFIMGCATIPLTFQEDMGLSNEFLSSSCMSIVWLISIGFSITFAALIAKSWRISMLYRNAIAMRRTQVLASHVFWIPTSVFSINVSVLAAWTIIDPLKWTRIVEEVDIFERAVQSKGTCFASINYTDPSLYFGLVLVAVNLFAFIGSGYQSYVIRMLPSSFNESFYLALTNGMIVESFLMGIPVLTVLNINPTAFMLVSVWIIVLVVIAVLLPMFGPKVTDKHLDARISFVQNEIDENTRHLALSKENAERKLLLLEAEEVEKRNPSFSSYAPQMSFRSNSNASALPRRSGGSSELSNSLATVSKTRLSTGGSGSILMNSRLGAEDSTEINKSVSFQTPPTVD